MVWMGEITWNNCCYWVPKRAMMCVLKEQQSKTVKTVAYLKCPGEDYQVVTAYANTSVTKGNNTSKAETLQNFCLKCRYDLVWFHVFYRVCLYMLYRSVDQRYTQESLISRLCVSLIFNRFNIRSCIGSINCLWLSPSSRNPDSDSCSDLKILTSSWSLNIATPQLYLSCIAEDQLVFPQWIDETQSVLVHTTNLQQLWTLWMLMRSFPLGFTRQHLESWMISRPLSGSKGNSLVRWDMYCL